MATGYQPRLAHVEGSFEELALEAADFLRVTDDIKPLLDSRSSENDVLAKLVDVSSALHNAPEKDFTGGSNLIIALVLRSDSPAQFLPALCTIFSKPIASSPVNGVALSLNGLTTIFNLLPPESPLRYQVLMTILAFLKDQSNWDVLQPYLSSIDQWTEDWKLSQDDSRKLYEAVADVAREAGHEEDAYQYILKALRNIDADNVSSSSAQDLALRALRMALLSNTQYLFQELRAAPAVQALGDSHSVHSQLLDVFAEQDLEDFNDFNEEHPGFLEQEKLDSDKLHRKMRLLTFASLAAATPNREIPYANIVKALQIPAEGVETWTIDAIRVGLVEGKLSQQKQMFLVHKITYRVFGQRQWQELSTRVDQWKTTLRTVLGSLLQGREDLRAQQEAEQQQLERKMAQANMGGHGGHGHGHGHGHGQGGRKHHNQHHHHHQQKHQQQQQQQQQNKIRTENDG